MRVGLRVLRVEVLADERELGFELKFGQGLNILRADNSSGKSTALQSIVYALGLEGMLSARRDIPLPHAMTDRVLHEGTERNVQRSSVTLEFENAVGDVVTVRRYVRHATIDPGLIRVWRGPAISEAPAVRPEDYFVRRPGAAQREAGFHRFLSDFLGWRLPSVTRMDGSEVPLYLECIFPFFYVEQKHGWSGVQARIPTYFGIRDVGKRSAEFVLGLEVFQRVLERQRLTSAKGLIEAEWQKELQELERAAAATGLAVTNAHPRISESWSDEVAVPMLYLSDEWQSVDQAIALYSDRVQRRQTAPPRTVGESANQLETDLDTLQQRLSQVSARIALASEEYQSLSRRRDGIELRVEALREDLQRHKDSVVLANLGSDIATALLAEHVCPTCHQEVGDGSDISSHAMTAAESVEFVGQQLRTFEATQQDVDRVRRGAGARLRGLQDEASEIRRLIRSSKDALVQSNLTPSVADVTQAAAERDRLEQLTQGRSVLVQLRESLAATQGSWMRNREALRALGDAGLSPSDERKLQLVEYYVREQLTRYHFSSLSPAAVDVSRDTYRPANEGFDLGFDLSASDMIRVIWSYLLALMRVSGETGGNHAGLLILDEPRQQETARRSYEQLLHEAAEQASSGTQILFATSEGLEDLLEMLGDRNYNLITVPTGAKLIA